MAYKRRNLWLWVLYGVGAIAVYNWFLAPKAQMKVLMPGTAPPQIEGELRAMASKQLNIPAKDIVVRSLSPSDLGLSSFTFAVSSGANGIVNTSVADNRFIALTGVAYGGSKVTQLDISAGGSARALWGLEAVGLMRSPVAYDTEPIIIEQNQSLNITAFASGDESASIALLGVVAERPGLVIGRD